MMVMEKWKLRARGHINTLVREGVVGRKPCAICGVGGALAHHMDYNKPLQVNWLCDIHHGKLHYLLGPELEASFAEQYLNFCRHRMAYRHNSGRKFTFCL